MKFIKTIMSAAMLILPLQAETVRKSDHPIEKVFLERQSKYALKRTLSAEDMRQKVLCLLEAARWAASSYNQQPWRFIYGIHGTGSWDRLFSTLVLANQSWAQNAGALILVVSRSRSERNEPMPTHTFEAGMAAAQLITQATHLGLATHCMGGFDREKARKEFKIPKDYHIEVIIAVGEAAKNGPKELAERDANP